jgi:hypothetical protein
MKLTKDNVSFKIRLAAHTEAGKLFRPAAALTPETYPFCNLTTWFMFNPGLSIGGYLSISSQPLVSNQ